MSTFAGNLRSRKNRVTAAFLIYASWSDYKTREVSNRVWAIYAPIALALSLSGVFDLCTLRASALRLKRRFNCRICIAPLLHGRFWRSRLKSPNVHCSRAPVLPYNPAQASHSRRFISSFPDSFSSNYP